MAHAFDAIIIGGGHNGLVASCYLALGGWKVLVLERRYLVGGACVTEEAFPGFKVSTAAYVNSLFRKEIIRELKLHEHGFAVLERSPSSFTPFPDGRYLLLGPDAEMTRREIAKFSPRDAENYPEGRYELNLQIAAEAGDQHELDSLFTRRSRKQTLQLGLILLVVITLMMLVMNLLSQPPQAAKPQPQKSTEKAAEKEKQKP